MLNLSRQRIRPPAVHLLFALVVLAVACLHSAQFSGRAYRQDEAWRVFGALEKHSAQETVLWVAGNIHPPLWSVVADLWVDLVGQHEPVARFLSTLLTALTLAVVFRLGLDLFGWRVALLAVFLLGTNPFFTFYSHEFRPYSALILATVASLLSFLRWVRRPSFGYALLFVLSGVAALYTHFFAAYALASLVVVLLVFVRYDRGMYLRAIGLFAAIGLSFLGWLLPFLHAVLVVHPGGIDYGLDSTWPVLTRLYSRMNFRPPGAAELLFLIAVLTPVAGVGAARLLQQGDQRFRWPREWRRWMLLALPVTVLGLALLVNQYVENLTQRSLVIVLPPLALFLAYGAARLPNAAVAALAALVVAHNIAFVDYEITGPQAEVAAFMAPYYETGSPIIMNVQYIPRHVAVLYYVQHRLSERVLHEDVFQVLAPNQPNREFLPYKPAHLITRFNQTTYAELRAFVGEAETVWYIERYRRGQRRSPLIGVLEADYERVREQAWENEYRVIEYARKDEND